MAKKLEIPIILAPPRAGTLGDFTSRAPVALVYLAADTSWSMETGKWPQHRRKLYSALIDTGAENTAIDELVAKQINAPKIATANLHGFRGSVSSADVVKTQILIPEIGVVYDANAAVCDFKGDGQEWDVVLGRSFLEHCRLIVDGPRHTYNLEWIEQATQQPV